MHVCNIIIDLVNGSSILNMTLLSEETLLTVTVTNATLQGGDYVCVVFNNVGYEMVSGTLYIAPVFTIQPTNASSDVGTFPSSVFTCLAESFPNPTYHFERMNSDGSFSTVLMIVHSSFGLYRCVASISINGTVTETFSNTALLTGIW